MSFLTLRQVGRLVDRFGSFRVGTVGAAMVVLAIYTGFYREPPMLHPIVLFCAFMFAMAFRNVAYNTLTSRVPRPFERARFQSLQSSIQHLSSAAGAFLSARLLTERADHSLEGMSGVALLSMGLSALVPLLLAVVEKRVGGPAAKPVG